MRLPEIIFFLLSSFLFTSTSLAQWEVQKTNVESLIYSLYFLDELNGWADTDSSFYLHTTNGGMNWNIEYFNKDGLLVKQIQFINPEIGYACGSLGTLLSTKDGGETWTSYPMPFEIEFWDLSFVNADEGWAVGERMGSGDLWGRGMIVHTSNGGLTWEKQLEIETTNRLEYQLFKSIKMKDSKEGWAIASDYFDNFSPTYIYKTTDGGNNWIRFNSPIDGISRKLKIASGDTLWVDGYGIGPMSISYDGGNSWLSSWDKYKYISAISPINGKTGWICAESINSISSSTILFTTDGGSTWSEDIQINEHITDIQNKGKYVWISGTNGTILRKNHNLTSVESFEKKSIVDYTLLQNYPNPFNSQTIISYVIPKDANVVVNVYDALGKLISKFELSNQKTGKHLFQWPATNTLGNQITSGVYFYQVIVYDQNGIRIIKSSKLLLIK